MKSKVSELLDGELVRDEAQATLSALREEGEAREAWRAYHLISDALRGTRALSPDFAARVAARLAEEPTVLAPLPLPQPAPRRAQWIALSAAASVAAVTLVGWLAFVPRQDQEARAPMAQAPAPATAVEPVRVPPPPAADDYLLAHQRYSPRNSLQGMAPYVRTVSGEAGARRP